MFKIITASALIAMLAVPATALDLGKGFVFDNTVTAEYSVEADSFTTLYEGELSYAINDELLAYAYTEVDLQDIDFTGVDLGLEYVPTKFDKLTVNTELQLDADLEYSDIVLTAEVKF